MNHTQLKPTSYRLQIRINCAVATAEMCCAFHLCYHTLNMILLRILQTEKECADSDISSLWQFINVQQYS